MNFNRTSRRGFVQEGLRQLLPQRTRYVAFSPSLHF